MNEKTPAKHVKRFIWVLTRLLKKRQMKYKAYQACQKGPWALTWQPLSTWWWPIRMVETCSETKKQEGCTVYVLCLRGLYFLVIKKVMRRNVGEQNYRLTTRSKLTSVSGENFGKILEKILEKILLSQRRGRG